MQRRRIILTAIISLSLAIIIFLTGFMPQVAQAHAIDQQIQQSKSNFSQVESTPSLPINSISNSSLQGIGIDLSALLAATKDKKDHDRDGLPDSVEWVLGTDPENNDSDFDTLDDYYEAANGFDPLKADSNSDGLPDNLEMKDVASDFDNDGIPNVWDDDNDNDGVPDSLDLSPFASSTTGENFPFDIQTNGNPTYVDFQIKPENTQHLKLPFTAWDWPADTEGQMQDRDGSQEDVEVYPFLKLTLDSLPERSQVEDYGIGIPLEGDSTAEFKVHGITTGWVDSTDYWNKEQEIDLTLFGGDSSSESGMRGYMTGYDINYQENDSFEFSRWGPLKDLSSYGGTNIGANWGAGAFFDVDDLISTTEHTEIFIPRIGGASIYQAPVWCGVDLDNFGNPARINNLLFPGTPFFSYTGDPKYAAGAGLDIADIDGNGIPDLLATFLIEGTNELACLIGWNLEKHTYVVTWPGFEYVRPSAWSYSPPLNITNPGCELLSSIPAFGGDITNVSVKLADVNGNGTLDWILMGTGDSANQLYYRIGWDLDTTGVPTSWSDIKTSPQIGGAAASGGATVIDLDGNDTLDLILVAVDNVGKHDFHYIIGWDIDNSGNPVSWSPVKCYCDAYNGFVTRGVTLGDVDGNGNPELILLGADEAADPNRSGYTIGWDFKQSDMLISPFSWSPVKNLPYDLGEYLGSGAFIDLNGNGKPEIFMPRFGGSQIYDMSLLFIADLDTHGEQQNFELGNYWWSLLGYSGNPPYAAGSGLDIADIDGNGIPDLLATFLIEGTGELACLIGWNLSGQNDPDALGWPSAWSYSPPLNVTSAYLGGDVYPDPLPPLPALGGDINNISVKIADLNGNGKPDWILMGTDSGANKLNYRIGWDLNTSGVPTSWSDVKTSPQIGGALAGGGAVATDLNGNDILDLLLLAVDNAEKHIYHYAVGWDINNSGNPVSWSAVYERGNRAASVYVPLVPIVDLGNNVALSGRMFFPEGYNENISADARLVWMATGKTDNPDGTSAITRLAEYPEDFMLTGFSATENYETDGGLFYSENKDQTIAAGFVLAYEFLRTQAPLADIPSMISKHKIADDSHIIYSDITSFSHQDAALVGLTSEMTENALDILPEGQVLPILLAMEGRSASIDLSELVALSGGSGFNADLRAVPITTAKMFRMDWYDTTTGKPVREDIITEMQKWGLEPEALENITKLILIWSVGDFTVTKIGIEETKFLKPEQSDVLDNLGYIFDFGLMGVDLALSIYGSGVGIYQFIKSIPKLTLTTPNLKGVFNAALDGIKGIEAARVGTIANVCKAVQWVNFLGDLLALGVAFYAFFDVAISSGWSEMGVTLGIWYFDLYLAYGLALVIIGTIPYVGWLIDLAIIISDAVGGWFSDFVEWFIGLFYEAYPLTTVNVQVEDSSFSFDDYDNNGLTVGDRVDFVVDLVEQKQTTRDNPWGVGEEFNETYINVSLQCDDSNVSDQDNDRFLVDYYGDFVIGGDYDYSYTDYLYENHFWAEPNQAMINLPWKIWLHYHYKIYYKEEFMGGWDIKSKTGSGSSDPFTIYLDVMPGNLDDFLTWSAITSLDQDHDGLKDSEDSSPSIYDIDGDGLPDGFEVLSSTNPLKSDTDSDGLSDLMELRLGTDTQNADTDGDGLSDGIEYEGWDITFTYCGQQFTSHVSSNPLVADTDNDGVTDFEEYQGPLWDCAQGNPRSQDTNGNGIKDRLDVIPNIIIESEADITEGETFILSGSFTDTDPDSWTATVDYGDGSGIQTLMLKKDKTFTLNHDFPVWPNGELKEEHPYSCYYYVTVSIADDKGGVGSAVITVTWHNFVPVVDAGSDTAVLMGQEFTQTGHWIEPGPNENISVFVDWGDGSSEQLPDELSFIDRENKAIYLRHVYGAEGTYTLTVSFTDDFGDSGYDSVQVEVKMLEVKIDIKPGSDTNSVNPNSKGVIQVAILTEDGFDTSTVDVSTLGFGPAKASPVHYAMQDVDGDGDADMVLNFRTQEVGLDEQDTKAILTGVTLDGISFFGRDVVRIVPPKDQPNPPGKEDAPGQNKEPGDNADDKAIGKDDAPGQNKELDSSANGQAVVKGNAPGQNGEPYEPADGKGEDNAPGQKKEPGYNADGKATGKNDAPGQNKEPEVNAPAKAKSE